MASQTCARCGREVLEGAEDYLDWAAVDPSGKVIVCPDCRTPDEDRAIELDRMEREDPSPVDEDLTELGGRPV